VRTKCSTTGIIIIIIISYDGFLSLRTSLKQKVYPTTQPSSFLVMSNVPTTAVFVDNTLNAFLVFY